MNNKPFRATISLDQLLLDQENPRLPRIANSQREAIHMMAEIQGKQMAFLADDIVKNGTNPQKQLIVVATKDEPVRYIALDGNRRLSTIRVLETPEILTDQLKAADLKKIKSLSVNFHKDPVRSFECMVYSSRLAADHWVQLEHRGQNEGRGTVDWTGQVAAKYDERRGKQSPALQVLRYLEKHKGLSDETRQRIEAGRFPVTTLDRLIKTRYVQQKLGITKSKGSIKTKFRSDDIVPGLSHIVNEIGERKITVSNIKGEPDRIDYVNSIDDSLLPNPEKALETEVDLAEADKNDRAEPKPKAGKKKRKPRKKETARNTIIPTNCQLNISHNRLNQIYVELKRINCDSFENSAGIMLRVFMELSLDYYIDHSLAWTKEQKENSTLRSKILSVVNHFKSNKLLSSNELAGIENAAKKSSIIGPTYKTLHGYVHNYHIAPIPTDLKNMWDSTEPFFKKIWE